MIREMSRSLGAALGLLVTLSASAQTNPGSGLGELREAVARAHQETPDAFTRLEAAVTQAEVLDARKRGTLANTAPLFEKLGPQALWPMVERLAFDGGMARQPAQESARLALQVGLLEATGALRDARLLPLWKSLLDGPETRRPARRAAAVALARLESLEAAEVLITLSRQEGPRGEVVREAMGECRRQVVAQALADALATASSRAEVRRLAEALGDVGSVWAWQTSQVKFRAEEEAVRHIAAKALVEAWLEYSGDVQRALTQALLRVDAPETLSLIQNVRTRSSDERRAALGTLEEKLRTNPLR